MSDKERQLIAFTCQQITSPDCYLVRASNGSWGYFIVHPNGLLMVYSDYGTYAYRWTAIGDQTIKQFLISLLRDPDYLLGKIAQRDALNFEETKGFFVRDLLQQRREHDISRERARELYDTINSFAQNEGEELLRWGTETPEFADNCWEWGSYDYPVDAKEFVAVLYPAFVKMLEEEVARGAQEVAQSA